MMYNRNKSVKKRASKARSENYVSSLRRLYVPVGAVLIVAAVFIAYLPSINGKFILDDEQLLTANHNIKASDGLYRLWFSTQTYDYWPVTYTTFWIEWRLWGMNPMGYRVANLVLHAVECLLIWVVLRKLSIPGAFLAAMIFAVHPVNVESVAWISQRKNTMAMLFFLLSILCYIKFLTRARRPFYEWCPLAAKQSTLAAKQTPPTAHRPPYTFSSFILNPSSFWYWLSLAAFVLAMLSKGSVVVLPALLLGIVWWLRPLTRQDMIKISPFFAVAVVLAVVNVWFQTHGSSEAIRTTGALERLLGAGSVVWFYLYKALLPIELLFVYPQWIIEPGNLLWWLPLLAALATTAVLWRYRKSWGRPLVFAWGFFCVSLFPVMGFTDVGFMKYTLVADHYQHIAVIGVIALAAALWDTWRRRLYAESQWAAIFVAVAALGTLLFLTWRQSELYRNPITLFQHTLEKNPNCWMAHTNLGKVFFDTGRLQEAAEHCHQALKLKSNSSEAYYNLGLIMTQSRRFPEAIDYYKKALALKPDYPEAYNNLCIAMVLSGQIQQAIEYFNKVLELHADLPYVHYNLGLTLSKLDRFEEAIAHYREVLRLKDDHVDTHINLGILLAQTGRLGEAAEQFQEALRLDPDNLDVYNNLVLVYVGMNRSAEAIRTGSKALEIARAQGQTMRAQQFENWLNSYRAEIGNKK